MTGLTVDGVTDTNLEFRNPTENIEFGQSHSIESIHSMRMSKDH